MAEMTVKQGLQAALDLRQQTAVPNVPVRSLAVRQFLASMNIPLNMPVTLQFSDEVPND